MLLYCNNAIVLQLCYIVYIYIYIPSAVLIKPRTTLSYLCPYSYISSFYIFLFSVLLFDNISDSYVYFFFQFNNIKFKTMSQQWPVLSRQRSRKRRPTISSRGKGIWLRT